MLEKPKMTINRLREIGGDTAKVFDVIFMGLIGKHWEEKTFRDLGIGLEGSVESFEEMIDKGILKIGCDEGEECFFFMIYNFKTKEYEPVGKEQG